jgi:hypothetical protein
MSDLATPHAMVMHGLMEGFVSGALKNAVLHACRILTDMVVVALFRRKNIAACKRFLNFF